MKKNPGPTPRLTEMKNLIRFAPKPGFSMILGVLATFELNKSPWGTGNLFFHSDSFKPIEIK